jgi:hypothetical protein
LFAKEVVDNTIKAAIQESVIAINKGMANLILSTTQEVQFSVDDCHLMDNQ